jgi:hypothetical protein
MSITKPVTVIRTASRRGKNDTGEGSRAPAPPEHAVDVRRDRASTAYETMQKLEPPRA